MANKKQNIVKRKSKQAKLLQSSQYRSKVVVSKKLYSRKKKKDEIFE
ncbi:MAG: hypothetical protein VX645_04010 [Pseudomonadota bacterium]|nr:hypothetical protein [Pseudomonadota bacterium]MEC8877486.1 hypothetical protein [Pseudomonadota bacterium]MEE3206506.1 hypothetical protein [Pseudomonadota bacterium]|tara:strand:+ start:260 stop:400 length:141 start_codon:yes stop_codon:yes gene_type:complete